MRTLLLTIQLFWIPLFIAPQDSNPLISIEAYNITFTEFVNQIEEKAKTHIYYQKSWVKDLNITLNEKNIPVLEVIKKALSGTSLTVAEWKGRFVILENEKLISNLPPYQIIRKEIKEESIILSPKKDQSSYLKGREAELKVINLGKREQASSTKAVEVSGIISEEISGITIPGATVYIEETKRGAAADNQGRFSLFVQPGKYTARFNFLGMEEKRFHLNVYASGSFDVKMTQANFEMHEVVIYGDKQMSIRDKDPGLEKISIKSIREIPMMMGEQDILKVSEMLPGIVSVGEGSSGINVRGGNADQNAFYINNIPIYNTSHLFGFFPAFNSEIIKDFSIYKGYIPASFGGRLSSVFDIKTREGNKHNYSVHGGVSPISANLVLEGPIKKETSSFIFSGRKSYSDWLLKKIDDPTINGSSSKFSDFTFALNHNTAKTQISAFGYYSNDYFQLADINKYSYFNKGASLNIGHNFSDDKRLNFSMVGSIYGFHTIDS